MFVHELKFKVAGVTFENEEGKDIQSEIKRIVTAYKKEGEIDETDLYGGYTNREIKEGEFEVDELDGIQFKGRIEEDVYENETCYKVYLQDTRGGYVHIGYIPRRKIEEFETYIKDKTLHYSSAFYIIGGKFKSVEDGKVVTDEDTYGAEVSIAFYNDEEAATKEKKIKDKEVKEKKPKTTEEKLRTVILWLTIIVIVCIALAVENK